MKRTLTPEEVMNRDLPPVEVTDSTVQRCKEYGLSVRKPMKIDEYEKRAQKSLGTPLP
jgi:hypothetical protein